MPRRLSQLTERGNCHAGSVFTVGVSAEPAKHVLYRREKDHPPLLGILRILRILGILWFFGGVKYVARSCLHLNRYGKEYRKHHAFLQTTVLENSIPSIPSIPRTHRVYSTAQTLRVPHREVCPDPRAKVGRLLTARVQHTPTTSCAANKRVRHTRADQQGGNVR
jgi:hypothetical protein